MTGNQCPIGTRDRALPPFTTVPVSALPVPRRSAVKALPHTAADLRRYVTVPDSAQGIHLSGTSKTRTRAWGTTFHNSPKNGHLGHCHPIAGAR